MAVNTRNLKFLHEHDSDKMNVAYEVNRKMVMFSPEVGGSHSVFPTFGTVIGVPIMHLKTYQGHDRKVKGLCFSVDMF